MAMRLGLILIGLSFAACSSKKQSPEDLFQVERMRFTGMGTIWEFEWQDPIDRPVGAANRRLLEHALRLSLEQWELATSDWSEESELRKLEKRGLKGCHNAPRKLLRALELSQLAYRQSEGRFDPAVGALLWARAKKAEGFDSLMIRSDSFCFSQSPVRLSFGGIVKGAVLGEWAFVALSAGLKNFRMTSGGSSVLLGPGASQFWDESKMFGQKPGQMLSISRSESGSDASKTIWDPRSGRIIPQSVKAAVACVGDSEDFESLVRLGALTDAWSTVRVVDPSWALPAACKPVPR
jgi:hypothetical protein